MTVNLEDHPMVEEVRTGVDCQGNAQEEVHFRYDVSYPEAKIKLAVQKGGYRFLSSIRPSELGEGAGYMEIEEK